MNPKILLAISSCERDCQNGYNQAVRDTWKRAVIGADCFFFVGNGSLPLVSDEIRIPAPDGYLDLPYKTREIMRWALAHGYDFVFKCDTDTYVYPQDLLATGFEKYDYSGWFNAPLKIPNVVEGKYYAWASGGIGYWLSRKGMQLVVASDPNHWAEDLWVGQVLAQESVLAFHDPRYWNDSSLISVHLNYGKQQQGDKRLKVSVKEMYEQHKGQRMQLPPPVPPPIPPELGPEFVEVMIQGRKIRIPKSKLPKREIMGQTERARRRGRR
jgi:hypothetical protein